MPVMNFDLEDGLPPVSFSLKTEDCERFMAFMAECQSIKDAPQRTWVGLTDGDMQEIIGTSVTMGEFIKNTEAKLKAKNERKEKNA